MTQPTRLAAGYATLFSLLAFGLFSGLDERRLWGDEAETAVLAVSITRFGIPRVDDGRNVIANLRDRGDSNESGIWTWSPWLDEYLAAGSFLVLGASTLSARLPFAALALLSGFLLVKLALSVTRRHEVALIALTLYATCVPLLLHARQARYYAVLLLAELWLMYGLTRCLGRKEGAGDGEASGVSIQGALHVALALAALFYCNYIVVPGNLIALAAVGSLAWLRTQRPPLALMLGGAGFAVLAAPWVLYAPPAGQLGRLGLQHFWPSLSYYALELHFHFLPWLVLALPLAGVVVRRLGRGDSSQVSSESSSELEIFSWVLLLASLLVYAVSPLRFFRYLIPLAPVLLLLAAVLIVRHIRPTWARILVVVVLASSNAIALVSAPSRSHSLEVPYIDFARSITSEYHERLDDVLGYFDEQTQGGASRRGQSIWVADPEFPLMFYTDLQIIDARYYRFPDEPPDWVLATSASGLAKRRPLQLPANVRTLYEEDTLRVRRSPRGGNRPDPHAHSWFAVPETTSETMRIYRRR